MPVYVVGYNNFVPKCLSTLEVYSSTNKTARETFSVAGGTTKCVGVRAEEV